jgi:cellulose biosynthesis protein BcsQ
VICTFYSYKGGVGRSMALANAADILARRGLRVLMIDFDLEAPGLEQYFPIPQERVLRRLGLLDLLLSYKQAMSATEEAPDEPAFKRLQELFLQPVYGQLPAGGKLDLLHAGQRGDAQQLARYALDLRMFDWQDFYLNWEGEAFFEWLRRTLVPDLYDVVLVDSRTGVTEMGGICAYQLADAIVMFCAANKQNLDGTRSLVADFFSPRVTARRRNRPLQVLIVPARIEQRDAALLAGFREGFEKAFEAYTPEPLRQDRLGFWDLLIPYTPLYAFDERVVARPDRPAQRQEIASSFRTLVEAISRLAEPGTALERLSPRSGQEREAEPPRVQYDVTRSFSGYDAVLFYDVADRGIVETITERLRVAGLSLFTMQQGVRGEESRELFASSLEDSKALLWFSGAAVLTASQQKELRQALDRARDDPDFRLIEVELPGSRPVEQSLGVRGGVGADLIRLSLRAGGEPEAVQQILKILRPEVAAEVPATAFAEGPPFLGLRPFREEDASLFSVARSWSPGSSNGFRLPNCWRSWEPPEPASRR